MEETNYLSIPFDKENEVKKERSNPLAPTYPTWSSRWKCCQTYLCLSMSFVSMLSFCGSLTKFGFALLIPYMTFTLTLGAPGVLVEVLLGRYGGGSVLRAWNICPPARGLFFCLFLMTCLLVIQRSLLLICIMKYLFFCFYGTMPWGDCNRHWARENCFQVGREKDTYLECVTKYSREYCDKLQWESSATQFWKYFVINSMGLNFLWNLICLTISILITMAVVFKGIYSLEKTLGFLIYPICVFSMLLGIVGLSVPNALKGFIKLCTFSWQDIINLDLWIVGFSDLFISTCLGTLSLSFISGHGKFTDTIFVDVFTVTFNSYLSCMIFAVPFLCVIKSTNTMDQDFDGILEVIRITSQAFLLYPIPKVMWSTLYFLNALFMTLSSQAIMFLALAEALLNIFKKKSMTFWILVVSCSAFILTVVAFSLKMEASVDARTTLAVNFLLISFTWKFFYGIENLKTDFHFMMGFPVPYLVKWTWSTLIISPIIILGLVFYIQQKNLIENLSNLLMSGIVVAIYILNILFYMLKYKKEKVKIVNVFIANPDWGPDDPLLKKSRKLFGVSSLSREFTYRQELNKKPLEKPPEFKEQNIVNLIYIN